MVLNAETLLADSNDGLFNIQLNQDGASDQEGRGAMKYLNHLSRSTDDVSAAVILLDLVLIAVQTQKHRKQT